MGPTIEIDRSGDLTLVLSKSLNSNAEKGKRMLLVSSKVLSLASPVFAAMLSPRFREGQRSESGTFDPLSLPDDDAVAMTTLCQVFHFRYDDLPVKPGLELLKNLAVLCDKYDCVAPLRFVSESWLVAWETSASSEALEILLFVSFVFGRAERLAKLSGRIVREFSGNLKHLDTLGSFDAVPELLLRGLQQQRKATLKGIEEAIAGQMDLLDLFEKSLIVPSEMRLCISCLGFANPSSLQCPRCRTATAPAICSRLSRRGEYVKLLDDAGLHPLRLWSLMATKSINEIVAIVFEAEKASTQHSCEGPIACHLKDSFAQLHHNVARLATGTEGLCLDCINTESESVGLKPSCSHSHSKIVLVEALEKTVIEE